MAAVSLTSPASYFGAHGLMPRTLTPVPHNRLWRLRSSDPKE
jgi:hypothetical protein